MNLIEYKKTIEITPRVQTLVEQRNFFITEHFLVEKRSNVDYWFEKEPTEWKEVFYWTTPTFAMIQKYKGKEVATGVAVAILKSSGINLSVAEQKMVVRFLISDAGFPGFTIMDLKFCLYLGSLGQLSKSYGDLKITDVTGLDGWFETYFKMRVGMYESIKQDEIDARQMVQPSTKAVPCPDDIAESLEKMQNNLFQNRLKADRFMKPRMTKEQFFIDHPEKAKELESEWSDKFEMQTGINSMNDWIATHWTFYIHEYNKNR